MKKPRRPFWFHPLLLAVFPSLSMLAANVNQVQLWLGLRMIALSLLLGILTWLGARLIFRRSGNAAPIASLLLLVLLSYGRLYDGLKAAGLSGETLVRHRYLIPVCAALVGIGIVWMARFRETHTLNRVLNVVSVVAVAFPLLSIGAYEARAQGGGRTTGMDCTLQPPDGQALPDVYLIVMDSYTRDDVLRNIYGYDNSPFLQSLEEMGFYVAHGSLSNYRVTIMSISSMLNMAYVQDYPGLFGARPQDPQDVHRLLQHSRVRTELECLGYVTVAIETGYLDDWKDASYYLSRRTRAYSGLGFMDELNRLEYMYVKSTAGRAVTDAWTSAHAESSPTAWDDAADHRRLVLFALDQLQEIPSLPSPKLVYAHIFSPHAPYVFGPNGETVNLAEFESEDSEAAWERQAYADQVAYLNTRLLEAIGTIVKESDVPPIIVLLGDHGKGRREPEDQLSNLSVYLVPESVDLYPAITPVNAFRLIFDGVFGGDFGRLPDVSYYSRGDWFALTVVPNTWKASSP